MPVIMRNGVPYGSGGINQTLSQAEYNALEAQGLIDPNCAYYITDGLQCSAPVDDTKISEQATWSSDKISALSDTLTFTNIDWEHPTTLVYTTNTLDDLNDWTATDDGVVNLFAIASTDSCIEAHIYDSSNNPHLFSCIGARGEWSCVYTFPVKKGTKYRLIIRSVGGTVYRHASYFYPFLKDIY